jgi:hypothetical protein
MKNIEMTVSKNILTIKIDLSKEFGRSKSGKTVVIATTAGNISIPEYADTGVKIGINCYK